MRKKTFLILTAIIIVGGGIIGQILVSKCTGDCSGLGYTLGILPFPIFLIWLYFGTTLKQESRVDKNTLHTDRKLDFHKIFDLVILIFLVIVLIYCIKLALP
jgi:hypothetical protein